MNVIPAQAGIHRPHEGLNRQTEGFDHFSEKTSLSVTNGPRLAPGCQGEGMMQPQNHEQGTESGCGEPI